MHQTSGSDISSTLLRACRFVVLAAMGGYGAVYLGWAIRTSDNAELVIKAKDLHPKVRNNTMLRCMM